MRNGMHFPSSDHKKDWVYTFGIKLNLLVLHFILGPRCTETCRLSLKRDYSFVRLGIGSINSGVTDGSDHLNLHTLFES